jgi:hypothetical protein
MLKQSQTDGAPNFYARTTPAAKTMCRLACIFYTIQSKYPPMY